MRHRPPADTEPKLGPLEQRVLEVLWDAAEPQHVHAVVARLGAVHAYTTVLTTMDRLFKKGLLERRLEGRRHVYVPARSRGELTGTHAARAVASALQASDDQAHPLLSFLVDTVAEKDLALLDELERLVAERRRRGGRGR